MSDYDKNKDIRRRRYYSSQRDRDCNYSNVRRGMYKYDRDIPRDTERHTQENKEKTMPQPTILLKNRESNQTRSTSPKQVNSVSKDTENQTLQPKQIQKPKSTSVDLSASLWNPPFMSHSVSLIDSNFMFVEEVQEYLQDTSCDFLVVGIIGNQGVGKSTIMNLLIDENVNKFIKNNKDNNESGKKSNLDASKNDIELNLKNLADNMSNINLNKNTNNLQNGHQTSQTYFDVENIQQLERGVHCTTGLNVYVTPNRTILLDSQPVLSVSSLDEMIQMGNSATAAGEIIPTENSSEIQSLQLAAFLLTVCHVVILIQDWFFDPNIIRFIQTAEMLKPSLTTAGEEELNEHSPHILLLHNRARMEDFNPPLFKIIQQTYRKLFSKSKLKIDTGLGIASGNIHYSLCPSTCGEPLNIFLLPEINTEEEEQIIYRGHPKLEELVHRLRALIQGATRSQLTHAQLSEKAWLHYASKAWDGVKKSSFFVEYNKLLP